MLCCPAVKESRIPVFPVSIRDQVLEENHLGTEIAERYRGIYVVECNHCVGITFVPEFRDSDNWPPSSRYAETLDWDAPSDPREARWISAVTSGIVVIGHAADYRVEHHDVTGVLHSEGNDRFVLHTVSIPINTFDLVRADIERLLRDLPAIEWRPFGGGGIPVSKLEQHELVRFLRAHILEPTLLDKRHLHLLALD
jgi:hypothetical protein